MKKEYLKNTEDKVVCKSCNGETLQFDDLEDLCATCVTDDLADSYEETVDSEYVKVDRDTRICTQCNRWNDINWWWHSETLDRWVCYPCGMGRRKEQDRIDARYKEENGNTNS